MRHRKSDVLVNEPRRPVESSGKQMTLMIRFVSIASNSSRRPVHVTLLLLGALVAVFAHTPAYSLNFWKQTYLLVKPLTQHADALPAEEIERLARLAHTPKGTKEVGRILGEQKLAGEVLEDTYLRIAVSQQHIPLDEAERMFRHLRGTNGFRTTLRKVIGNSHVKSTGHLNELRIAYQATQHRFVVKGIGVHFSDPRKGAPTDIDLVLERNGRVFAIEAKDYAATTALPLDSFRADMDSLIAYAGSQAPRTVIPIFSITHKPADPRHWRALAHACDQRGVQLIEGSPDVQIELLKALASAL